MQYIVTYQAWTPLLEEKKNGLSMVPASEYYFH